MNRVSFITWYPSCRRSDTLASALGGTSHLIHYLSFKRPLYAPFKYVLQSFFTWRHLLRDKPHVVLVASPPVFAAVAVWIYCRLSGSSYIIDAHTGVFDDSRWTWALPLSRFLSRGATTTIVTNSHLQKLVQKWGAHSIIIGDVPVSFGRASQVDLGPGPHVTVVNTFSQDEPLDEILEAAKDLPHVRFHVTGSVQQSRSNYKQAPSPNVNFTGWVSDEDYAKLLKSSDVIMCLTTHDYTMQRGAYEAMALEKPLITSDWGLLRETFHDGTIHVKNSPEAIAQAVIRALDEQESMEAGMKRLRMARLMVFEHNLGLLRQAFTSE
jgi:glycosyltransferase involved in cell wall biosynthesis